MLAMVMAKPIQFTIVIAEPRISGVTFRATNDEKRGESATTLMPQQKIKVINIAGLLLNTNGESKQQTPETNNATAATGLAPKNCESQPLITQAKEPEAITKNDAREISVMAPI